MISPAAVSGLLLLLLLDAHVIHIVVVSGLNINTNRGRTTSRSRVPNSLNAVATATAAATTSTAVAVAHGAADLFQTELNAVGLGLCHGILHASGCRRLSDLRTLTPSQITTMGVDQFDRPVILRVMDDLEKSHLAVGDEFKDNGVSSASNTLSTLVNGAFEKKTLSRFEVATKQDFCIQVICAENNIFKGRLFTETQCAQLSRMAEYHAYHGIETIGAGWTNEIYTLTAQHMACESVPGFLSTTSDIFRQLLRELYMLCQKPAADQ